MSDKPETASTRAGFVTEVVVPQEQADQLHVAAKKTLGQLIERYSVDVLSEAEKLEITSGNTGGLEITSARLEDADMMLRRGYRRPPKSSLLKAAQIAAAVGGLITGLLLDRTLLDDDLRFVVFILVLTITIAATVFAVVKE